jgi:PAS domain S-box-containing protein
VHPADRDRLLAELPAIFEKDHHSYEYRFKHQDGHYIWMRDDMSLVRDERGDPLEIVGYWIDITERKKAEEALREAHERLEERVRERTAELQRANESLQSEIAERKQAQEQLAIFRKFAEASEQALGMADLEGHITYANPTLCRVLGAQKPEDAYGTNVADYYSKEDLPTLREKIIPAVIEQGHQTVEMPLLSADGKVTPSIQSIFLIRDDQGRPFRLANVITDITERKRAEQELARHHDQLEEMVAARTHELQTRYEELQRQTTERKKAEEALRESLQTSADIVNSIGSGLFTYQYEPPDRLILLDGNPAAERFTGIKVSEWIGREFNEIWPEAKQRGITDSFLSPMRTGETYETEDLYYKDEKLEGAFKISAFRMPGNRLGVAFENVTERKKAEEALRAYQEKLRSLASELSLAEERERRRVATELHDQISQSLVISKMKLEALGQARLAKQVKEELTEVCEMLGETIGETRTLTFDLSPPILYELGFEAAVAEWLEDQIERKHGIKTQFEDDGSAKPLDDDIRVLLFRNVRELLINVIKHAHANKVTVRIGRDDGRIRVNVEDDGVGFERDRAMSVSSETGGFGLFSIRQRLDELGGRLEIESSPGHGCKTVMTAPLRAGEATKGS